MELAAQQARRNAMEKEIARIGKDTAGKTGEDPTLKPLQMRHQLLSKRLERSRKLQEKGVAPLEEAEETEVELAEVEAEIVQRQRQMRQAGGGEFLGELTGQLAMQAVEAAEAEARLEVIREQLLRTKDLLAAADTYESEVAIELPLAQEAYELAKLHAEALRRRLRFATPPIVTILGQD